MSTEETSPPRPPVLGYGDVHPFRKVNIVDRESVQELLRTLLDPLAAHFSPHYSRVRIPGGTAVRFDDAAAEIEGYARPLWGLASLLAGGGTYEGTWRWIEGLKAGTDPESPEFWGLSGNSDQRMVEMCCLGYTLAVAPPFWEALNEKEKFNVETYLGSCNDKDMPNTNWLWFRVFANLGLKKNGAKYSKERLVSDIKHLDTFYRGDGWSNDGPEGIHMMDYYSGSYAIQMLQLLYAKIMGDEDPDRAAEFRKRAQMYALDFIHYFDEEGSALPFGRSLVYKFAMIAFWSTIAFCDVELPAPLTWGMVKGILLRNLRWWQQHPDIFGPSGTLTIGYCYPNMYMAENYNSPGSPYWSCIAFIGLAAPESHPLWSSEEEPFPTKLLSPTKMIRHPGHVSSYLDGHRLILSSGQACSYPMKASHAKYGKFVYSSEYGYSVPSGGFTLEQFALDSTLGLSDDGGEVWKTRRLCSQVDLKTPEGVPIIISDWAPFPDVRIRTYLIPPMESNPSWHIRAHRIEAGRDLLTADGSFAIRNVNSIDGRALRPYDSQIFEGTSPRLIGNYDSPSAEGSAPGSKGAFAVSRGAVGIAALEENSNRLGVIVNADPNTNLLERRTVIPTLTGKINKGDTVWYVTGIFARPTNIKERKTLLDGWDNKPPVHSWLKEEISM